MPLKPMIESTREEIVMIEQRIQSPRLYIPRHSSVLDLIGNTPMVRMQHLANIAEIGGAQILLKLEGSNPGGSIKDRIAKYMISEAEKRGELTPGKTIVEATSGNTGIGLTLVGKIKGYAVKLYMSVKKSLERKLLLNLLGAELVLVPSDDPDAAIREAKQLATTDPNKYFYVNQNENDDNWLCHYYTTAQEILQDIPIVDVFVAGVGTGGTLIGVSRKLQEHNPYLRVVSVQPLYKEHKLEGLKNLDFGYVPTIYDNAIVNQVIKVADEDAIKTVWQLAKYEGILCGLSSGAVAYSAIQIAQKLKRGTIVAILADRVEKYFSTDLFHNLGTLCNN
jgi:cysteine synthase